MFGYLWRHKAFSVALLCLFGIGLYLQPIAAWFGLALLLFLRLTKVHSLLLIYDLTDRAALKHVRTLATKRAHMLSPDEYGNMSEDTWDKHLNTFIKKTLLPEFQRRKIDHLLAKDPKRHVGRLRTRINRIIDRYQPAERAVEFDDAMTGREFELYCRDCPAGGWMACCAYSRIRRPGRRHHRGEGRQTSCDPVQILQRHGRQQGGSGGLCRRCLSGCALCGGGHQFGFHQVGPPARA